jgi:hypothetical protein
VPLALATFPPASAEYALANKVEHPRTVYGKGDQIVPRLDSSIAAPHPSPKLGGHQYRPGDCHRVVGPRAVDCREECVPAGHVATSGFRRLKMQQAITSAWLQKRVVLQLAG